MTLRPSELAAVAAEIAGALVGKPVQKVVEPDGRTLLLGFPRAWLLVSLDPRLGRVHLLDEKPPGTGEAAPAFCMLARKHLVGARLEELEAVAGERALRLGFLRSDGRRSLIVFLYGAGARAVLVDESGTPLGALGSKTGPAALPPPRSDDKPSRFAPPDVSDKICAHYAVEARRIDAETARQSVLGPLRKERDRLRRLEAQLEGDLARMPAGDEKRRHADLLLAHLAEVPRGAQSVELPDDFGDGRPLRIALDPSLSAQENAARLYREQKKAARGRGLVEKRLADARDARARAEAKIAAVEASPDDAVAKMGPTRTTPSATPRPSGRRPIGPAPPYKVFRSATGHEILVGRSAAKNDELTFKVAHGDDLWLHTRDVAGAHVIVPVAGRNTPVDEATLLDAATLAVHHSPARDEGQADVTYAPRKLVRKPRGAPPGTVTVAGGRTLRLRMEPARLERLLASRSDDKP